MRRYGAAEIPAGNFSDHAPRKPGKPSFGERDPLIIVFDVASKTRSQRVCQLNVKWPVRLWRHPSDLFPDLAGRSTPIFPTPQLQNESELQN